jgi:dimethylargininase
MTTAICRGISPRFNECEITHIGRRPINLKKARAQHEEYVRTLAFLGCTILELPEEKDFPDSVFVEDTAIVLPEIAIIANPGAVSRAGETESIARVLAQFRPIVKLPPSATLDGGDVLVMGRQIYVGMSTRSNFKSLTQLRNILSPLDYQVIGIEVHGCLHLKSAVSRVNDDTVLINRQWVDGIQFNRFKMIDIAATEPHAANCLPLHGEILFPSSYPKTRERLERVGFCIRAIDLDEITKAEGAVTCCSLILDD